MKYTISIGSTTETVVASVTYGDDQVVTSDIFENDMREAFDDALKTLVSGEFK